MITDVSFLVFTNEMHFSILNLTLPFLIKNVEQLNRPIYVVSNKIPNETRPVGAEYIDANEPFSSSGHHFRNTLMTALKHIDSKYVVFMCDDYLVQSAVKADRFNGIINMMDDLSIDFFSMASQKHMEHIIPSWKRLDTDLSKYNLPNGCIYELADYIRHMYSVQPCVWKVSSLITLLSYNENMSLHELDSTDIRNMRGKRRTLTAESGFNLYTKDSDFMDYGFRNFCYHLPPLTYNADERAIGSDYFIFDYIEIVRHGKFIAQNINARTILHEILSMPEYSAVKQKLVQFM